MGALIFAVTCLDSLSRCFATRHDVVFHNPSPAFLALLLLPPSTHSFRKIPLCFLALLRRPYAQAGLRFTLHFNSPCMVPDFISSGSTPPSSVFRSIFSSSLAISSSSLFLCIQCVGIIVVEAEVRRFLFLFVVRDRCRRERFRVAHPHSLPSFLLILLCASRLHHSDALNFPADPLSFVEE
ncbi:hypothetical protein C8R47DRAFT_740340 [Mycena vitilis]|nr:hypothetical protein C8R47DRAFT_740340 [Mycena vitilis]